MPPFAAMTIALDLRQAQPKKAKNHQEPLISVFQNNIAYNQNEAIFKSISENGIFSAEISFFLLKCFG